MSLQAEVLGSTPFYYDSLAYFMLTGHKSWVYLKIHKNEVAFAFVDSDKFTKKGSIEVFICWTSYSKVPTNWLLITTSWLELFFTVLIDKNYM